MYSKSKRVGNIDVVNFAEALDLLFALLRIVGYINIIGKFLEGSCMSNKMTAWIKCRVLCHLLTLVI